MRGSAPASIRPFSTDLMQRVLDAAGVIILGKGRELKLVLACLLARGHMLIEDLPEVGKTTLARLLWL